MLSVIIPVYKVEGYIERCLESFVDIGIADIEYIFIDDCTPDKSASVVEVWLEKQAIQDRVTIHHFERNCGISAVRNKGLELAHGDYVFFCDSDDYIEAEHLRTLYQTVVRTNSDIGWGDWILNAGGKERYMKQCVAEETDATLIAMLNGSMRYNLWNKIFRRALFTNNHFLFAPNQNMGEDMMVLKLFATARRITYLNQPVYHYCTQNLASQTKTYKKEEIQSLKSNITSVLSFLRAHCELDEENYSYFQLNAKLPFLISESKASYKIWQELFPECNQFIMRNKAQSLRTRLLQYVAWKKCYGLVWLYNILIYRIVSHVI